jgi:hypothetical protein
MREFLFCAFACFVCAARPSTSYADVFDIGNGTATFNVTVPADYQGTNFSSQPSFNPLISLVSFTGGQDIGNSNNPAEDGSIYLITIVGSSPQTPDFYEYQEEGGTYCTANIGPTCYIPPNSRNYLQLGVFLTNDFGTFTVSSSKQSLGHDPISPIVLDVQVTLPDDFIVSGTGFTDLTTGVPEPSTWAMLLIGFAGIGSMAYRRKQNGPTLSVA